MANRIMKGAAALLAATALSGAGPCDRGTEPRPGEPVTIKGVLTDEGVECRALRGSDGRLYTLAGDLGSFRTGDEVCVKGRVAEVSYCMQGITVSLDTIRPASECP